VIWCPILLWTPLRRAELEEYPSFGRVLATVEQFGDRTRVDRCVFSFGDERC
jgi:hypothetical protein